MEWIVLVSAEITFPSNGVETWKKLRADPAAFGDWKDEFAGGWQKPDTAGAVIERLSDPVTAGPEARLRFEVEGRTVRMRGFLEEHGYRACCATLATALRVAAGAGGEGSAHFVNAAGVYAYAIALAGGGSVFSAVKGKKALAALQESDGVRAAAALMQEVLQEASPGLRELDEARERWSVASGAGEGTYGAVVAALERRPLEAIARTADELYAWTANDGSKIARDHDPRELLRAFRETRENDVRARAVSVLAQVDPATFEPLGAALLREEADMDVAAAAARGLASARSDEALDALLGALDFPGPLLLNPTRDAAAQSLAKLQHPGVAARMADRIRPETFTGPDRASSVLRALDVLDAKKGVLGVPVLLALFSARPEPEIRARVAQALVAAPDPEARRVLAGAIADLYPVGDLAARAIFAAGPDEARAVVALLVERARPDDPASLEAVSNVLRFLEADAQEKRGKSLLASDRRLRDLALSLVDRRELAVEPRRMLSWLQMLLPTKDPRLPGAFAALLAQPRADVVGICEILRKLRDAAVVPALEEALRHRKRPVEVAQLERTLRQLAGKTATSAASPPKRTTPKKTPG